MSNDKKTLADVRPGGRVQVMPSDAARALLAAQYRDDGDKAKAIRINHKSLTDSDKRALRAIEAALSAQPSPGGQGGALLESLVARWRKDADEVGISDNTLCQKIANCTMRHAAELQAVLAARQPVELIAQKVGAYRVTVAEDAITVSHGRDIVFAYSAGDAEPINARQPVGEPVGYANIHQLNDPRNDGVVLRRKDDDGFFTEPLFRRPPAQAVDMGLQLDRYDAGLLGDGGGGDVCWWQDYIRTELDRAHEFYQDQADAHG